MDGQGLGGEVWDVSKPAAYAVEGECAVGVEVTGQRISMGSVKDQGARRIRL